MSEEGDKRSAEEADAAASKRVKETVDKGVVDEFTCPITNELPLDPVIGEDWRCYDRAAIEEHFRRGGSNRRSPVTNEPIGPKLTPALQVRNMLERFVKDGLIQGEKADQWKKRIEDEKYVAELRRKAWIGDKNAMDGLGIVYEEGRRGIKQNYSEALKWYEMAAELGHFSAMASLGVMHLIGKGTEKNISEGIALIAIAAQGGSSFAAAKLGTFYAQGSHGLVKSSKRARLWLERVEDKGEVDEDTLNRTKNLLASLDES